MATGKKYVRMRRARKSAVPRAPRTRRIGTKSEFASAKQTVLTTLDNINTVYDATNIALYQFDRLVQIARAYQYYRITKIEWVFKPEADTFTGTTGTVPYFLYLIDKGEVYQSTTFNEMRDAGAKPIRFDDKSIRVSWKPRVPMVTNADSTGNPALSYSMASKTSPWLLTNANANSNPVSWVPSTVPHKGLYYGVQATGTYAVSTFTSEVTVHVQFKKPLGLAVDGGAPKPLPTVKEIVSAPEPNVPPAT